MARTTGNASDLITFTRASTGMALTKVAYGPELFTQTTPDFLQNASASGLTVTATGTSPVRASFEFSGLTVGSVYSVTGAATGVPVLIWDEAETLAGGVQDLINPGDNLLVATSSTMHVGFKDFSPGAGEEYIFSGISVREVLYNDPTGTLKLISHPTNKPRVEYDANGVAKGLLIEEARTNLVTYSEDFSIGWAVVNSALTTNTDVAPDGTTTADTILCNAVIDTHGVRQIFTTVLSAEYAASCWFKKQNYSKCGMVAHSGTYQNVTYDFDADTLTTYGGATATRELYGDFVRVTLLFSAGSTSTTLTIGPSSGAAVNNPLAFSASGVQITFWGAQLEQGSFPTSYIPTSGATATRSADIASVSVSDFGYNQAQGSVVVEANPILSGTPIGLQGIVEFNNGTTNDQITIINENNDRLRIIIDPTSAANDVDFTISGAEGSEKYAAAWATNDVQAAHGGLLGAGDTSSNPPATITTLTIGNDAGSSIPLNGHIKSLNYYPLRLSDAKLQSLTS